MLYVLNIIVYLGSLFFTSFVIVKLVIDMVRLFPVISIGERVFLIILLIIAITTWFFLQVRW